MTVRSLRTLFVMDSIEAVDIEADTTFVLMLEAQRRGHEVLYCGLADLVVRAGGPQARARSVKLKRERGAHAELGPEREWRLDDEVDVIFQRKDPPVDADYVTATQLLALCQKAIVLNRPESVIVCNEKLYALQFPDLMPETRVAREIPDLLDFFDALGGEMIVKPLHGKGGEGVFLLRAGDLNLSSILEQITAFETRWVMAQRFIPDVMTGDKRILLLEGEALGAVLRVPSEGETRANFHAGGRAAKATLGARDREIVARIAPRLRADGLFFVGIDVIGDFMTEINVTSPTGMQEIDALDGVRLEQRVIARVEDLVRG